jgi:carboxylesterase
MESKATTPEKLPPPSFSNINGPIGCLLIHGFGDSADLMRPMGDHLSSKGISVRGITLPGHGTSLDDFSRITAEKLLGAVETQYLKMKSECDLVVVVGFSMGGLLALQLATLREVDGIVTICTPMFLRGGWQGDAVLKLASKLGGAFGASLPKAGFSSLADKTLSDFMTGYEKYPFRGITSLMHLMETTRPILERVRAPILVAQSLKDDLVWKKSGQYLVDSVASDRRKLLNLENSRHKAPIDIDRHILFDEISRFAVECASS